jgi:phosphocarrier protein HPr
MIVREFTVLAPEGLHARPAKELAKLSKRYVSNMVLKKDGESFNPRSLIGLVTAQATYMSKITMEIDGADENEAALAFDHFFDEEVVKL